MSRQKFGFWKDIDKVTTAQVFFAYFCARPVKDSRSTFKLYKYMSFYMPLRLFLTSLVGLYMKKYYKSIFVHRKENNCAAKF